MESSSKIDVGRTLVKGAVLCFVIALMFLVVTPVDLSAQVQADAGTNDLNHQEFSKRNAHVASHASIDLNRSHLSKASVFKPMKATRTRAITKLRNDDDLFDIVDTASGVVLIDFYADWCGPCRKQSSVLKDLEQTAIRKNASIIKIDVDQHQKLAKAFKVSSLPTLLVVKDGKILERRKGLSGHKLVTEYLSK
jgi:thioredoxin 1